MPFITATSGLYVWYLFIMYLLRRKRELRDKIGFLYYVGLALGLIGVVGDVAYNLTFGSLVFLEIPRELTLSQRMSRLGKDEDGWRKNLAQHVCKNLLNKYDPSGEHC